MLRALIQGDDGKPDEAKFAFLVGFAALIWGTVYSVLYPDHPFHAEDFSIGLGALLGFYNASKGRAGTFGSNKP